MTDNQKIREINISYPFNSFDEDALFKIAEEFNLRLRIKRARFTDSSIDVSMILQEGDYPILKDSIIGIFKSLKF